MIKLTSGIERIFAYITGAAAIHSAFVAPADASSGAAAQPAATATASRSQPHRPHVPTTPPQRKAATSSFVSLLSFAHLPAPLSPRYSRAVAHFFLHTPKNNHPHLPGLDDYCAQHRDDRLLAAPLHPQRQRWRWRWWRERAAPGRHQAPRRRGLRRQRGRHRRAQLRSGAALPLGAVPRHPDGASVLHQLGERHPHDGGPAHDVGLLLPDTALHVVGVSAHPPRVHAVVGIQLRVVRGRGHHRHVAGRRQRRRGRGRRGGREQQHHHQQPGVGRLVFALVVLAHRRVRLRRQRGPFRRRARAGGGRVPRLLHVLHGAQARRRMPQVWLLRPLPPQPQQLRLRSAAVALFANLGGPFLSRRQSCKQPLLAWLDIFHKN